MGSETFRAEKLDPLYTGFVLIPESLPPDSRPFAVYPA